MNSHFSKNVKLVDFRNVRRKEVVKPTGLTAEIRKLTFSPTQCWGGVTTQYRDQNEFQTTSVLEPSSFHRPEFGKPHSEMQNRLCIIGTST